MSQDPTARHDTHHHQQLSPPDTPRKESRAVLATSTSRRHPFDVPPLSTPTTRSVVKRHMLLRKEVIQPHLPVRLPCYDLVPIASPTFDGSPHKG